MNPRLFFKQLMSPLMRIGTPLSVLLIALIMSQSGNAQAIYGSIVGNVKDRADAFVSGATVKITHKETNQTRETTASQVGNFNFPTVQTGTYEIAVSQAGFKTYMRSGIEVTRNNITRSDITLEIGGVSETVSVTERTPTSDPVLTREELNRGLASVAQQGGDSAFQFFSQEMSFDSRWVKGAPFSADIVTETIQTLPDGNRIVQRLEGRIYRDSQGRTRNERTFLMGGTSDQKQTITIFDPANGVNYNLDPETRVARKVNSFYKVEPSLTPPPSRGGVAPSASANGDAPKKITVSGGVLQGNAVKKVQPPYPPIAKAAKASGAVQVQVLIGETGEVIDATVIGGHPLLRDAALQAARQWVFKPTELSGVPVKVQGILTFNFTLADEVPLPTAIARSMPKYNTNTEQLAKQMVEGVECEGTRAVTTMPAGAIGNERPIETVNETWYSQELKMMILSKRSDPRFGETTYRVTNINRSEPDASLFQIPSEYTIIDSGVKRVGMDVREIEEARRLLEEVKKKAEESRKPNNQ
ncbi:MAG TPA: TonB family protein [Blastocatellia bacterium]|nr:TonB family protein [Blastocatellia bacterium]